MKATYLSFIIGLSYLCFSCSDGASDAGHDEHHEHEHNEQEAGHGSDEIHLEPETAQRFGVATTKATLGAFSEVIKVSGQILAAPTDQAVASATSAGIITFSGNISAGSKVNNGTPIASISAKRMAGGDANTAAKTTLDATKRELDRITPLHSEGIVSTKEYNAAKQAYETALAAYSGNASGSRVTSPISGAITQILVQQGQYVEAGQPVATISKNSRLTLRADLPEKYYKSLATITSANFQPAYSDSIIPLSEVHGRLVSTPSTASTGQTGYIPIYFSFDNNGMAIPGAYAEVYLLGTQRPDVLSVPIEAVTEQQGINYVYIKTGAHEYQKSRVTLGISDGKNIEILSGLKAGDEYVSKGAIIVKLAESSGVVPEGHSHNH